MGNSDFESSPQGAEAGIPGAGSDTGELGTGSHRASTEGGAPGSEAVAEAGNGDPAVGFDRWAADESDDLETTPQFQDDSQWPVEPVRGGYPNPEHSSLDDLGAAADTSTQSTDQTPEFSDQRAHELGESARGDDPARLAGSETQNGPLDRVDTADALVGSAAAGAHDPTAGAGLEPGVRGDNARHRLALLGPVLGQSTARSAATEASYLKYVATMYRKAERARTLDFESPPIVRPTEVVSDLIAAEHTPTTWELYRAALLWHCAQNRSVDREFENAYQLLKAQPIRRPVLENATKHKNKKSISEADLRVLLDQLSTMNATVGWGDRTRAWLLAGLASGARPSEWLDACWVDDEKLELRLLNAKRHTTLASFQIVGPGQTIHDVEIENPERIQEGPRADDSLKYRIVPIDDRDTEAVNFHMRALEGYLQAAGAQDAEARQARFVTYYNMCRKILRQACVDAFSTKKRYSLNVMRSQFSSNKKATLPLDEVKRLMGHAPRSRTTMGHYGPAKRAHGGVGNKEREVQAQAAARAPAERDKPAGG